MRLCDFCAAKEALRRDYAKGEGIDGGKRTVKEMD